MQASASQDKKPGKPSSDEGANDSTYENMTSTFRNHDQSKSSHPAPVTQGWPRTPPDTSQVPLWLHRAIMSLYVLLVVIFAFCIILSALVLVKNSEMSKELQGLKEELWNVSNTVWKCQHQQRNTCNSILRKIQEAKSIIQKEIQDGKTSLKTMSAELAQIKNSLKALEMKTNPQPSK